MADEVKAKVGITATKEALVAAGALAVVSRKAYRDCAGDMAKFPLAFGQEIMQSPEAVLAIKQAFGDAKQIPSELKDLDMMEGIELAECALAVVRKSFIDVKP